MTSQVFASFKASSMVTGTVINVDGVILRAESVEFEARMIVGLFHPGCTVGNLDQTLAFYRNILGISEIKSQTSDQPYLAKVTGLPNAKLRIGFIKFLADHFPLEVVQYLEPKGGQSGAGFGITGTMHLTFRVNNLRDFYINLKTKGVNFLSPPYVLGNGLWKGWLETYIRSPDGGIIGLVGQPDRAGDPGQLMGIHHITITCSDLQPMKTLLCKKLGLQILNELSYNNENLQRMVGLPDDFITAAYLAVPGTKAYIELWQFRTPAGPPAKSSHNNIGSGHLCFLVDDMQSDYEMMKNEGVAFVGPPALVTAGVNQGGYAIYFSGPDGIKFELFQKPK